MNGDAPHVFGDYYLLTTLASGGMGTIHLAKRVGFRADIQRFFAVKKLPRGHANARELRRFHDEARVVVTLNHRALCSVFDVGVVADEHYLAMELIEGVTLQRALAATKFPQAIALYVVDEMLDALDYAHHHRDPATGEAMQIVHRDVSPQNVMLSFQGGVKLIDFGLVSSTLKQEKTVVGVVVGKLEYMSPEQARGEALDARSDVYAAAIIAFEMLSGRRFYEGLSKSALSSAVVEGNHAPSFEGVDARLVSILQRALAPERDQRTASCAALQKELASFARASSRDLRDALQAAVPEEQARLAELIKSFRDVGTEQEIATSVKHIARSSSDPDWSEEPTLIAAERDANADTVPSLERPPPQSSSRSGFAALTTGAVVAALAVLAAMFWVGRADETVKPSTEPQRELSSQGRGALARDARRAASVSAREAASVSAREAPVVGRATASAVPDDAGVDDTARAVDDSVRAVDDPSRAVDDTTRAVGDTTRAVGDTTRAVDDSARAVDDPSRAVDHNAHAVDDSARAVDHNARTVDDTSRTVDDADVAHPRPHKTAMKRARPPNVPLPDVAAQLDYLAQWCSRLTCAKPLLASRGRIALLDVVGLRSLRKDADACVVECRR